MATLTLRIDDRMRVQLEELAHTRSSSVSDLLREAIGGLLGVDVDIPRADTPRSMSMVQRRTLVLLHEILQKLSDDHDDYHARRIQVLNGGFTTEYHQEFFMVDAELSPSECGLLMDILDMFTVLEAAIGRLNDEDLAALGENGRHLLEFKGFDHNDSRELRLAGLAEYLIRDGRWSTLAHHFDDERDGGNSHMPALASYQRMLPAYKSVIATRKENSGSRGFDIYRLDIHDLQKVIAAIKA